MCLSTLSQVFDFLADFSNSVRWDPGVIAAAKQKETDEIKVGGFLYLLSTRPICSCTSDLWG